MLSRCQGMTMVVLIDCIWFCSCRTKMAGWESCQRHFSK